ncbi:EF hand [Gemmata sp. SH-PL17]|uniref:EF-hand domain-containing protein n=1 Tax=Gemmata sp. SH-PL17 TaxID=1630693 RepID=UPI00078EB31E|nr:EF-hand domain-containing protein [Gemmata sp. SH-PL17]AMV30002.1 EF hand [Gemmata sp. SH-PL17]
MPHTAYLFSIPLVCLLAYCAANCNAAEDQEQFEEKTVARCAERVLKNAKNDRTVWLKELESAFPGKVMNANTEEEYATWFVLLIGKGEQWHRDSASPGLADLFDRVVQRLELGPVPSITREEFTRYAKRLMKDTAQAGTGGDPVEDADKVFRVLDRNGNGELEPEELTSGLKDEKDHADADGNGRITKEEYRGYFQRKVTFKADQLSAAAKANENPQARGPEGKPKPGAGLPEWFATLDTDKDGQIALFEWRKDSRPIALFNEMDLNGDGLLTRDEYLRYVRMTENKLKQERREVKE